MHFIQKKIFELAVVVIINENNKKCNSWLASYIEQYGRPGEQRWSHCRSGVHRPGRALSAVQTGTWERGDTKERLLEHMDQWRTSVPPAFFFSPSRLNVCLTDGWQHFISRLQGHAIFHAAQVGGIHISMCVLDLCLHRLIVMGSRLWYGVKLLDKCD